MSGIAISAFYIGAAALLLAALSMRVSLLRQEHQVSLGDGGVPALNRAIRAHGNTAETAPLCLMIVIGADLLGAPGYVVHLLGAATLFGRAAAAYGIDRSVLIARMLGGLATLGVLGLGGLGLLGHALIGGGLGG